jgi:hypothetical protein
MSEDEFEPYEGFHESIRDILKNCYEWKLSHIHDQFEDRNKIELEFINSNIINCERYFINSKEDKDI